MGKQDGGILTVTRPPFGGSNCGAVDHKLLGCCIIDGFGLQALKVRPLGSRRGVRHGAQAEFFQVSLEP